MWTATRGTKEKLFGKRFKPGAEQRETCFYWRNLIRYSALRRRFEHFLQSWWTPKTRFTPGESRSTRPSKVLTRSWADFQTSSSAGRWASPAAATKQPSKIYDHNRVINQFPDQ